GDRHDRNGLQRVGLKREKATNMEVRKVMRFSRASRSVKINEFEKKQTRIIAMRKPSRRA
ncbi:23680_t:CDS:1, partial [Gigaspora rosea]